MKSKIEYTLVEAFLNKKFNEEVNKHLEDEWQLFGRPNIVYHSECGIHRCQAFIRNITKEYHCICGIITESRNHPIRYCECGRRDWHSQTEDDETTDEEGKFIPWDKPLKADFTPWEKEDIDYTKVGLKYYECKECFTIIKCNHHPIKPCKNCNTASWRKK